MLLRPWNVSKIRLRMFLVLFFFLIKIKMFLNKTYCWITYYLFTIVQQASKRRISHKMRAALYNKKMQNHSNVKFLKPWTFKPKWSEPFELGMSTKCCFDCLTFAHKFMSTLKKRLSMHTSLSRPKIGSKLGSNLYRRKYLISFSYLFISNRIVFCRCLTKPLNHFFIQTTFLNKSLLGFYVLWKHFMKSKIEKDFPPFKNYLTQKTSTAFEPIFKSRFEYWWLCILPKLFCTGTCLTYELYRISDVLEPEKSLNQV